MFGNTVASPPELPPYLSIERELTLVLSMEFTLLLINKFNTCPVKGIHTASVK